MNHTAHDQDGATLTMQWIEREFERQRTLLSVNAEEFDEWNLSWKDRQSDIDASLNALRQKLTRRAECSVR